MSIDNIAIEQDGVLVTSEPSGYDAYVREKVCAALTDQRPDSPVEQVFNRMRRMIEQVGRA